MRALILTVGILLSFAVSALAQTQTAEDPPFGERREYFRDWLAACREDTYCSATAYVRPGSGAFGEAYVLRVGREGGDFSQFVISFTAIDDMPAKGELLNVRVVGGPAFALAPGAGYMTIGSKNEYFFTDQAMLDKLFPAMKAGSQMSISFRDDRGETHTANFSLRGMSAALKWINKDQIRAANESAVGPPPMENAKQEEGDADGITPLQLPPAIMALQGQVEACEGWVGRPSPQNHSRRFDLGEGLSMFIVPCTPGTNNPASRIYLVEKGRRADAMLFAVHNETLGWTGTDRLVNAAFDKESGILSSRFKAEGSEGCGTLSEWEWRDGNFVMQRVVAWKDCAAPLPAENWQVIYQPAAQ
ncbi:MAG: DUF1176 domain-containing protein [Hyphomicrobiales bacterium]